MVQIKKDDILRYKPIKKPMRIFSDSDKDLTPNIIDCEPSNPRKQGVVDWLKEKKEQFDQFQTERRSKKLMSYQQKAEIEEAKQRYESTKYRGEREKLQLQKERLAVQGQRVKLMQQRQKTMPKLPGFGGGGYGGFGLQPQPSAINPFPGWVPGTGEMPKMKAAPKKKTKTKKKAYTIYI